jgi:hypothetical protein
MQIEGERITTITCSLLVAASLRRIFAAILAHYGSIKTNRTAGMDAYDGAYADRNVRGSSTKRDHAQLRGGHRLGRRTHPREATYWSMPASVVQIFAAEGWRWGGSYSGRKDALHCECAARWDQVVIGGIRWSSPPGARWS